MGLSHNCQGKKWVDWLVGWLGIMIGDLGSRFKVFQLYWLIAIVFQLVT